MPALRLSLFYAAFFLGWGCVLPYWPVWYETRGLSPQAIGIAAGVGLLARMLISPLAAFWSDGLRRAKDPLIALSWLTLAFWIVHLPLREPWILIGMAFLTGAALYPIIPLSDALAIREARRGGFAFGPLRAVGSAAFIVSNLGCGALIGIYGGETMLVWMIAATAIMAGAAHLLPAGERLGPAEPARERLRALRDLIARPDFLLALTASGLITGSHAFYYSFSALAWRGQGIAASTVGALWAAGVAAEIAFFALSARMSRRLDPALLMAAGGVAGIVRWAGVALTPSVPVLFGLQLLHAFSFGAVFLGFVLYADRVAGDHRASSALALNSAVSGGAASAVLAAASGWLFAHYGTPGIAAMIVPCAAGVAAALMLIPASRRRGSAP